MKKRSRIISGALAALLATALAGCVQDAPASSAPQISKAGGYVEEDVSPDHNYNVGLYAVGDTIHAFTVENAATPLAQQTAHWYMMGSDGQWQEQSGSGFEQLPAQVGQGTAYPMAYMTQDGSLYWSVTTLTGTEDKSSETTFFAVEDGKASRLDALPAGEVSVAFGETTVFAAACGDTLLVMDNSVTLHAYDASGAPVEMELPELDGNRLLCGNANGYYALGSDNQVYHYTLGGVTAEMVLDGGRYPHESMYLLQHLFNNWFLNLELGRITAAAVLVVSALLAGSGALLAVRHRMRRKEKRC